MPAEPRLAASVVLLRGGDDALELLLVQRTPHARFMGGVWVFPGGAVDAGETLEQAALRELAEEAAVALPDGDGTLVPWSQWITPEVVPIRYDTHFFLAAAPPDAAPRVDGEECVDWGWFAPAAALERLALAFPTRRQLEQLGGFAGASALLAHAAAHEVVPVLPRVVGSGETARVLLPGDPGY
jgi:8-oxo-dGTP pyrophosphatase MutT (NUDIX family)